MKTNDIVINKIINWLEAEDKSYEWLGELSNRRSKRELDSLLFAINDYPCPFTFKYGSRRIQALPHSK
ncbi:hypothetical protein LAV73_05780 [Lysinibacillus xylanilyticus]|uniref:hypothetical protein n=1 Tax=Lysinibacillus xylanilyticus TaxID=582475 RepID=UPI002B244BFB|nr:hypothetical protein [Lysinibacillus xylanilyticus]MEB2279512.1 hypothetical protein [Lysinibacillus xylanilyticus]